MCHISNPAKRPARSRSHNKGSLMSATLGSKDGIDDVALISMSDADKAGGPPSGVEPKAELNDDHSRIDSLTERVWSCAVNIAILYHVCCPLLHNAWSANFRDVRATVPKTLAS